MIMACRKNISCH